MLRDSISAIRLNPACVAESPTTPCRYIGRNTLSPMIAPQPQALAVIAQRTTGFLRMAIGISGSGALSSRSTNKAAMAAAAANNARIVGEVQEKRAPPRFKASMNATLAPTMRTAPATSTRCGRS